jgi:hypothetical protein
VGCQAGEHVAGQVLHPGKQGSHQPLKLPLHALCRMGQGSPACTAHMFGTAHLSRRQHASAPPTKWLFSPVINSTTSSGTARGHRECPPLPTCGVGKHGALLPAHVLLHVAAHTVKLQGRYGDRQGAKRQKITLETQA